MNPLRTVWPVVLLLAGCPVATDPLAALTDEEIAAAVWLETTGYETWDRFDSLSDTPTQSSDHQELFVLAYYNAALLAWDLDGVAPTGALALKEAYDAPEDTAPSSLTVMRKIDGYDPAGGDWFWAEYTPEGDTVAAGGIATCVSCHSASTTDYVFGG